MPGLSTGSRQGIIETTVLATELVDAVALLSNSPSWTPRDQEDLVKWFAQYLKWLQTDPLGMAESLRSNNHGMWYDVQTAAYAAFTGDKRLARNILAEPATACLAGVAIAAAALLRRRSMNPV